MKKWMLIGATVLTILIWFAVFWLYLGQQEDNYVLKHSFIERNHTSKSENFTFVNSTPTEKSIETDILSNDNQQGMVEEIALNADKTISIDVLLNALKIVKK